jgi:hypothetical protein
MLYAITKTDGSVALMRLIDPEATVESEIAKWPDQGQSVVSIAAVTEARIPRRRTFREAWRFASGSVVVDMPAARTIKMNHIRVLRDAKLRELDVAQLRAMEANDQNQLQQIAQQKQTLRDIPQTEDLSRFSTPDVLEAYIPEALR